MRKKNSIFFWCALETYLLKYGSPLDKQEKATQTVLMQEEVQTQEWAAMA